jgi:hypothetical protein
VTEAEPRAQFDAFQVEARRILWALEHEPGPGAHLQAAFEVMQAASKALRQIAENARALVPPQRRP